MTTRDPIDLGIPIRYHITIRENEEVFSSIGAFVLAYSEIDFILTDMAILLSRDMRYLSIQPRFPARFKDKVVFWKKSARVESEYKGIVSSVFSVIDECGIADLDEIRAMWAHSKLTKDQRGGFFTERYHKKSGMIGNNFSHIYTTADFAMLGRNLIVCDEVVASLRELHNELFSASKGLVFPDKQIPGYNE